MQSNPIHPEQLQKQVKNNQNINEIYENAIPITMAVDKNEEASINDNESISMINTQTVKAQEIQKIHSQHNEKKINQQNNEEKIHQQLKEMQIHQQKNKEKINQQNNEEQIHHQDNEEKIHQQNNEEKIYKQDNEQKNVNEHHDQQQNLMINEQKKNIPHSNQLDMSEQQVEQADNVVTQDHLNKQEVKLDNPNETQPKQQHHQEIKQNKQINIKNQLQIDTEHNNQTLNINQQIEHKQNLQKIEIEGGSKQLQNLLQAHHNHINRDIDLQNAIHSKQEEKEQHQAQIKDLPAQPIVQNKEIFNIQNLPQEIAKKGENEDLKRESSQQKEIKQQQPYKQQQSETSQKSELKQQQANKQQQNQITQQKLQDPNNEILNEAQQEQNQQKSKQTSNIFIPKEQINDNLDNNQSKQHHIQKISTLLLESKQIVDNNNKGRIIQKQQSNIAKVTQQIQEQNQKDGHNNVEEKHKYKLTSENIQSLQENNKDQQPIFVQFTQYVQVNQDNYAQIVHSPQNEIEIEPPQDKNIDKKEQISNKKQEQNQINITFAGIGQASPLKTVEISQDHAVKSSPKQQIASPSKQHIIGKIAKKNIFQNKVHEVIVELQKYDQKKTIVPRLQQKKSNSKRTINLSRLQPKISLQSNIINLTVGELLSQQKAQQQRKLLSEIDQLKRKLYLLQTRKTIQFPNNDDQIQDTVVLEQKPSPGKIYRTKEGSSSRMTEQQFSSNKKTLQYRTQKVQSAYEKHKNSTVSKNQSEFQSQFKKTGLTNFRIRRNSKGNFGNIQSPAQGQKEAGFIRNKSRFQQKLQDQNFQTRRQDFQVLQFEQEQKLNILNIPVQRQLDFQNYFRQYCEKFFIELGGQGPKRQHSQQQLVTLAKNTFRLFGINLAKEKKMVLNVKKYKNCVSFIINQQKTILWYYQGKFYFGGWVNNPLGEGEKVGWGYDYVPGKYIYSGYFDENKRNGYGVMKLLQKDKDIIYEGNWVNGLKHGLGKQIQSNNSQYVGYWSAGKKQGQGKLKQSDKELYEGQFAYGFKSGLGEQTFKNGDSYQGEYKEGKFNGKGIYIWANGSKYEGNFVEGSRNGTGKWVANYKQTNSDSYEGVYLNDKKNGFGIYKWKDGMFYEGQFLNDLKHGEGIVSYSDGKIAKLKWFEGNVVPAQPKQKSGAKKLSSNESARISSSKAQSSRGPVLKYNYLNNESRSKPTRVSKGFQNI